MILGLFRRNDRSATIRVVYGAIVAQSREPVFYSDLGVPDTVEGRFDLLVLHLVLLIHRLKSEPVTQRELGQELFDTFIADFDSALREMGVGDLTVPKKMNKFGEAFYGRVEAYDPALDAGDAEALAAALSRNIYAGAAEPDAGATALARYAIDARDALRAVAWDGLAEGRLPWPRPPAVGARS